MLTLLGSSLTLHRIKAIKMMLRGWWHSWRGANYTSPADFSNGICCSALNLSCHWSMLWGELIYGRQRAHFSEAPGFRCEHQSRFIDFRGSIFPSGLAFHGCSIRQFIIRFVIRRPIASSCTTGYLVKMLPTEEKVTKRVAHHGLTNLEWHWCSLWIKCWSKYWLLYHCAAVLWWEMSHSWVVLGIDQVTRVFSCLCGQTGSFQECNCRSHQDLEIS